MVKPDQLFGKRGKHNLLCLNATLDEAEKWINERMNKETVVGKSKGTLTHFLVEPFVPHKNEYYVAIRPSREEDTIYFSLAGGVDVEENWDKVKQLSVPVLSDLSTLDFDSFIPSDLGSDRKTVISFIKGLYQLYKKLNFAYLEINPFTLVDNKIVPLDTVAKLDDTAAFECSELWGEIDFPAPFGRTESKEEAYIAQLDEKSGSSLKLSILNPDGRLWLMVAGGGASVIYTDTICDIGYSSELANYGEYSGNPTTDETREYAKTVLNLMTRKKDNKGKALLIGGGIANFTDVAKTFTGIIQALEEYRDKIVNHNISIFVRRGGPNYKEGLENITAACKRLGISIEVYGPETHMTRIVPRAIETINN